MNWEWGIKHRPRRNSIEEGVGKCYAEELFLVVQFDTPIPVLTVNIT